MHHYNEVLLDRISHIKKLAEDICEVTENDDLSEENKFHDISYFMCEMLRVAFGHKNSF